MPIRSDTNRLEFLLSWLDHNEDVRELPVRDWIDHDDARKAIDEAIDKDRAKNPKFPVSKG